MSADALFEPRKERRALAARIFYLLCAMTAAGSVVVLGVLLYRVWHDGSSLLSLKFLNSFPSQIAPAKGGVKSALWGTVWLIFLTAFFAIPTGVGAAVYLQEYAPKNRFTRLIQLNIANLAGVPSIVYGLLGLAVFVRWLRFDRSVLSGSLTMSLLILPVIIIASREAIAAVPKTIREAAFALGATRWQTVRHHVLPAAAPGILTGVILSMARAMGETAPLIMIGALTYIRFVPGGTHESTGGLGGWLSWFNEAIHDPFVVMPIQIFNWAEQAQPIFHKLAAAGIVVLLTVMLIMNGVAVALRAFWQRKQI